MISPELDPIAIVLPIRPISLKSRGYRQYQDRIKREVQALHRRPFQGRDLYVQVVWFHSRKERQDLDNIAKRILDALKGAAYDDDSSVAKCMLERVFYTEGSPQITGRAPASAYRELIRMMAEGMDNIIYVEVGVIASSARAIALGTERQQG